MFRDRLGRLRQPNQERGLRPIHPRLPSRWISRALRVAMEQSDWVRFDALAKRVGANAPTQARAYGETLTRLLDRATQTEPESTSAAHWLDWERSKALGLLVRSS